MGSTRATAAPAVPMKRFGAFGGVFTPSILTILGVVMYMRTGWVVGNVGLAGALLILGLAHAISFTTGLSVASISTNRTVGVGGAYFMISRSLGGPAGAAIGIPLFLAQALSIAFYIVGFAETLELLVPAIDSRLIGTAVCVALTLISLKGADLAIKTQFFVMGAIGLSLLSFFLGRTSQPTSEITWWTEGSVPFVTVFAVFFPAVTGIMAGVSMSGDLREPRRDLPRGTLSAILVGLVIYTAVAVWLAVNLDTATLAGDLRSMWKVAWIPPLIYLGVWAATLSSAMGSILAAPRTLQALAGDRILPRFLARGSGPANEPRIGLAVTFGLAEAAILLGGLDVLAQVLTMFFLVTYGVTNLACGLEKWAASPSFRPSFAVPWWISLAGAVACFYVMSIIDLVAMLAAMIICAGIYVFAQRQALGATFGDARHGIWSALVRTALQRHRRARFHPMNWRPNLIIFGGSFEKRSHLAELGSALVQDRGIVSFFHLVQGEIAAQSEKRRELMDVVENQVTRRFPSVFTRVEVVNDIYHGLVTVTQSYGLGNFEANTVMLGWLRKEERRDAYLVALQELFALDRSVLVVRFHPERGWGLDRKIDIWWGGLEKNGALMLVVAFLLTSHDRWREAEVRVLTVVRSEKQRRKAEAELRKIVASTRLAAVQQVIFEKKGAIREIMRRESAGSDLVLVGLRQPRKSETAEGFFAGYDELLEGLPTVILVSSAPSFEGAPVLFDEADLETSD